MTDRLSGAEVREFQGQAADPPVSNAGESRSYFNTTSNRVRVSVNGEAYVNWDPPVDEVDYIPLIEARRLDDSTFVAPAVLEGGSYRLDRQVLLNRVVFRCTAFAAAAEGIMLIYQDAQGRATDSLALVATVPFTPVANMNFEVVPNEGEILLSSGLIYALWGQVSGGGSFSLSTYNTSAVQLTTTNVPTGVHPTTATSALNPAAPPATLDPFIGGDLVANGGSFTVPILRFRNV